MRRPVWIAFGALVAAGLLTALALWRTLDETESKPKQSFVPRGATVLQTRLVGADRRVVTWRLGGQAEDVASGLYGVTIWQGKRRLYTHRARTGAVGLHVETGDFTRDGLDDVLVFDDTDGSGGCGTYRALAVRPTSVDQVHVRLLCIDQGSMHLRRHGLVVRLGVRKNPETAFDIHCCYQRLRTAVLRWNGRRLVPLRVSVRRLEGRHWPPGGYPPGGA